MITSFASNRRRWLTSHVALVAVTLAALASWPQLSAAQSAAQSGSSASIGRDASDEHTFAVLSYIGDSMEVVSRKLTTGSNIEQTDRNALPIPNSVLDDAALGSAGEVLQQAGVKKPVLLAFNLPALYAPNANVSDVLARAPSQLLDALKADKVTDLLLILKARGAAEFKGPDATYGYGHVEGLGFFLDFDQRSPQSGRGAVRGFLAPYSFIRIVRVKLPEMTVIKEVQARASEVLFVTDTQATLPWDVLDAKAKIDTLNRLTKSAIQGSLPQAIDQ